MYFVLKFLLLNAKSCQLLLFSMLKIKLFLSFAISLPDSPHLFLYFVYLPSSSTIKWSSLLKSPSEKPISLNTAWTQRLTISISEFHAVSNGYRSPSAIVCAHYVVWLNDKSVLSNKIPYLIDKISTTCTYRGPVRVCMCVAPVTQTAPGGTRRAIMKQKHKCDWGTV